MPLRLVAATHVLHHNHIPPGYEVLDCRGSARIGSAIHLVVGRTHQNCRKPAFHHEASLGWEVDVGGEPYAVPHRDHDVFRGNNFEVLLHLCVKWCNMKTREHPESETR